MKKILASAAALLFGAQPAAQQALAHEAPARSTQAHEAGRAASLGGVSSRSRRSESGDSSVRAVFDAMASAYAARARSAKQAQAGTIAALETLRRRLPELALITGGDRPRDISQKDVRRVRRVLDLLIASAISKSETRN